MEQEKLGEQSEKEPAEVLSETVNASAESDSDSPKIDTQGGMYGTFKSADALYEGYKNLLSEFTKKCQKLSEFEKEKTQENKPSKKEIEEDLSAYLLKNADAKNYSEQLKEKVMSQNEGTNFENAWAGIVMDTLKSKDSQKYESPIFKKYVFDDEQLKNKVIEIYLEELKANKPPVVLNSDSGQQISKIDPVAPKSLKEAKRLMEDMFS